MNLHQVEIRSNFKFFFKWSFWIGVIYGLMACCNANYIYPVHYWFNSCDVNLVCLPLRDNDFASIVGEPNNGIIEVSF